MKNIDKISRILNLKQLQVKKAIDLLDGGNTIPFIARYRKEATGGLDEESLRSVAAELEKQRKLTKRRDAILASIEKQGKLTPALKQELIEVDSVNMLEDLYQPFKPKRKTRASEARNKGLQVLADQIMAQETSAPSPVKAAAPFVKDEVKTIEEALSGARDIASELISDHPQVRQEVRRRAQRWSLLKSEKIKSADDPRGIFQSYYDFQLRVDRLRPHQVLAINRAESKKVVRLKVKVAERDWQPALDTHFPVNRNSAMGPQLKEAREDAAQRLLLPAIERDIRRALKTEAEEHAIAVFATNLRGLLNQPPLAGFRVLGIDPGLRTGCKIAAVDVTGGLLDTGTFYLPSIRGNESQAKAILAEFVESNNVSLIAIGNGTGSRECEELVANFIQVSSKEISYLIADEAGASVYSASKLAKEELPDLDVTLRGAVSIARRVQDPLAELVKIDPKSIGVGLYQHDVDQRQLSETLKGVVESVVNQVGVDLNTASIALLTYVAGIGPKLAAAIVQYRDDNGPFYNRKALYDVPGLGPKAFQQSAGFLRIRNGSDPLDASAIHPESYQAAAAILTLAGTAMSCEREERKEAIDQWRSSKSVSDLARDVGTGVPTLEDILDQLVQPGRDPRAELPAPLLRKDVLSIEDLQVGMRLKGTIRNVVDFGAFVDIGLKNEGLLHRSQWPQNVRLIVGDIIEVSIQRIEPERNRIALAWPS